MVVVVIVMVGKVVVVGGDYHRSSHGGAPSLSMCRPKMGHWVDLAE